MEPPSGIHSKRASGAVDHRITLMSGRPVIGYLSRASTRATSPGPRPWFTVRPALSQLRRCAATGCLPSIRARWSLEAPRARGALAYRYGTYRANRDLLVVPSCCRPQSGHRRASGRYLRRDSGRCSDPGAAEPTFYCSTNQLHPPNRKGIPGPPRRDRVSRACRYAQTEAKSSRKWSDGAVGSRAFLGCLRTLGPPR